MTQQSLDPPDPARLGTVRELADGYQLRFERHFRHPLEKVWAALTTPSDRAEWFAPGEIELTLGGRVALAFTDGKSVVDGEVTAIEPPRLLEFTWDDNGDDHGSVRWELAREDEGTHLILTHTLSNASRQFGLPALAGWHTLLEKLTVLLDGQSTSGLSERWQEFHDHYAALEMLDDQFSTKGDTTK